ncbi:MAG: NAD(P)-dependent oxidoreductase [Verrucomicrobiae bacterium]|nr:NAD(P)-dependent oxidoreductase [Verrucomicrobiae bacterium]
MKKILVTGGAGYIGSSLVFELLQRGHSVQVVDSLMYGGRGLLPCFAFKTFQFKKADLRDPKEMAKAMEGKDAVIHLAAIVGYPACKKDPKLAEDVNVGITQTIVENAKKGQELFYASTGSNYGALVGDLCTEETPLNPLSVYGVTKTRAERLMQNAGAVVYRFATAFGVSNRFRLDLLINDFVYRATKEKNLIIYEKSFKRTFIHIRDIVRAFCFAIDNHPKMHGEVFNVGHESMNFSKEDIANKLKEKMDFYLHYAEVGKDEDQRNYEVSYEKIRKLGFETTISVDDGIDELIRAMAVIHVTHEYSNV